MYIYGSLETLKKFHNWVKSKLALKADATALEEYTKSTLLAKVATSGSYNDLANTPTIPDISGKVDKTTTINGKALSSDVTLSASDVGAMTAQETTTAITSAVNSITYVATAGTATSAITATTATTANVANVANGLNTLQRSTAYAVGDIAYSANLPSWAYLECTTAGTTGTTEPTFDVGGIKLLNSITDGTTVWQMRDKRCRYEIGQFVSMNNSPKDYQYLVLCDGTANIDDYPRLKAAGYTEIPNLTERILQGASNAGEYREAGLPNIEGTVFTDGEYGFGASLRGEGCLSVWGETNWSAVTQVVNVTRYDKVTMRASDSNSIYGNSNTVQPPAYTTKIYICYAG